MLITAVRAGMFEPLPLGQPDFKMRLRSLLQAMGNDLLNRVNMDSEDNHRWAASPTVYMLPDAAQQGTHIALPMVPLIPNIIWGSPTNVVA